jgi:hypothetical protein
MTAAIPIPNRLLALLGVAVLVLVGLLVARPLLTGSDDSAAPAATPARPAQVTPAAHAMKPSTPAKAKIVLLPGLPHRVASKLMHSRVAVVSVYSGTSASDHASLAQARAGAKAAGVPFVAINVLDETAARQVQAFGGTMTTPAVLVVKRPGKIVARFESTVDDAVVQQAAHNARGGKK